MIGAAKQGTFAPCAQKRIAMPTLIRLLVILLVLVGLAYGGMFALVAAVDPGEKEITVRIPTRDLVAAPQREPLVRREIDTSRTADSPPRVEEAPADAVPADAAPAAEPAEGQVRTLEPGAPE